MQDTATWPRFFQPSPGSDTGGSEVADVQFGSHTLDLFYWGGSGGTPVLCAVIACLGGGVSLVPESQFGSLSESIQTELNSMHVSRRGVFREIRVASLYVGRLDAVEQQSNMGGYNDSLHLYATLYASLKRTNRATQPTLLNVRGRLMVGRLDMLAAIDRSVSSAMHWGEEAVYGLLVPGGTSAETEKGANLVLLYPFLDPARFAAVGNSFVVTQIAFDLLGRLQHDVNVEQPEHPFARSVLPVPNRLRLEDALAADNYEINGDWAVKKPAQQGQATSGGLLARLRALAQQWSAAQIPLPPQGTMQDYQAIICSVGPSLRLKEDQAMADALSRVVIDGPALSNAGPETVEVENTETAEPHRVAWVSSLPHTDPRAEVIGSESEAALIRNTSLEARKLEWDDDFSVPPPQTATASQEWWQDFALGQEGMDVVSITDWEANFTPIRSSSPTETQDRASFSAATDWPADFEKAKPPRKPRNGAASRKEWSDDFTK